MDKPQKVKKPIFGYILFGILWLLSLTLGAIVWWSKKEFGVSLNEIFFTLAQPLTGTDGGVVQSALLHCLPIIIIGMALYGLFIFFHLRMMRKGSIKGSRIFRTCVSLGCVAGLLGSIVYANGQYDLIGYIENWLDTTEIYNDYYVDPTAVSITATEKKNLIFIYLESMETSYASVEDGGNQAENLIPHLTQLAEDNVSFSNTDKLGGFRSLNGTGWTFGALFSSSNGVPYNVTINGNLLYNYGSFADNITSLGDVLEAFGYRQMFLCGSDASYADRDVFFETHGNYEIFDLDTAREKGYIEEDYSVNWGFEDEYLYEIAKDQLTEMAEGDQPFNLTMLTVDTHFPDGYICNLCDDGYPSDAENAIACADNQLYSFLRWCQRQDFYEDTAIVIIGDHPRMDTALVDGLNFFDRTMYNCFINASAETENRSNRSFTTMDIFPTTLTALGFDIEVDKLGLCTNLFSEVSTLAEQIGYERLQSELCKTSDFFGVKFT